MRESLVEMGFGLADLRRVRQLVVAAAVDADLPWERADELAVAVNEIATNAIVHGRPPTTLRIWRQNDEIVCEVADRGPGIKDPLAGHQRPPADAPGGRGLWLARLLCDAVEIRNGVGCTVSLHATTPVRTPATAG
jgi:serine/threonine-protein kinase RsbW